VVKQQTFISSPRRGLRREGAFFCNMKKKIGRRRRSCPN
jgi:hypothetical protein